MISRNGFNVIFLELDLMWFPRNGFYSRVEIILKCLVSILNKVWYYVKDKKSVFKCEYEYYDCFWNHETVPFPPDIVI